MSTKPAPQRESPRLLLVAAIALAAWGLPPAALLANEDSSIKERVAACESPPSVLRVNPRALPKYRAELCQQWTTPPAKYEPYFFEYASVEDIETCLEMGSDPNAVTEAGTPLHAVVGYNGNPAIVHALLQAGSDPNGRDACERTPLHYLAITALNNIMTEPQKKGEYEVLISILTESGAEVEARDCYGYTPLHSAAYGSENRIVASLLNSGSDPNGQTDDGNTPLHIAAGRLLFGNSDHLRAKREITDTL